MVELKIKYADGFGAEIFSFKELELLHKKALLPKHKEHVTTYFWDNSCNKNLRPAPSCIPLKKRYLRSGIDTRKDLKIINKFVKKFKINFYTKTNHIVDSFHKYKYTNGLLIKKD